MARHQLLEVPIDEERLARLRRESERTGTPVGTIVREAIDNRLAGGGRRPKRFPVTGDLTATQAIEDDRSGRRA